MSVENKNRKAVPISPPPIKQYVSERKLVEVSGLSCAFWQKDRWLHKGKEPGCPYIKVNRSVRYELGEALAWLERGRRGNKVAANG